MKKTTLAIFKRYLSQHKQIKPKICVVGGGPAGFYAAQHLSKHLQHAEIDIIERLPVPFGLVRFGVAPDHPEVKNVINTFTKTARQPNVRFVGNINLGTNVTVKDLNNAYHIVLLTYGAERDRKLHISGEDLPNVLSARSLVGWYNGIPWDSTLKVDLSGRTVAIIGQGNVAIDVARILLTPIDLLRSTDITEHSLQILSESKIKRVHLVGRRGPLQAAFTIKELREMLKLERCVTTWTANDFRDVEDTIPSLARPRKRLTELMIKSMKECVAERDCKQFVPQFFRSPLEINGGEAVRSVTLGVNKLVGDDLLRQRAFATDHSELLHCDVVVRSIGYKSIQADYDIPFDDKKGVAKNVGGMINDSTYAAGWLGTGPTGVILSTMSNAFDVASRICKKLNDNPPDVNKPGFKLVKQIMDKQNIQTVSWNDWEKIDRYEQDEGKQRGKPREKIVDISKMLNIAS